MLRQFKNARRDGVAATEFAMVLPVLLILTFGTIEVCQVIFLKEKAVLSAHEGARAAIKKMSTKSDAIAASRDYMTLRGIDMSTIKTEHVAVWPDPEKIQKLEPINVRVRIPLAGNTLLPNPFYTWFSDGNVEATVVMYKEFAHPNAP